MENRIKLLTLNIFYLLGAILFLTLGNFLQSWHFEIGLIITEYVLVLGFSILIIKFNRAKISDYIHLKEVSKLTLLKTILIVALSLPIVMILNLISIYVLELMGKSMYFDIPMPSGFLHVIFQFLIISISAGICEEIFFRGVILNAYSDYFSYKKAIVISAVLFGVFHFNIENILGPIYLGIVFGIIAIKTKSIIPAIIGHMTNNGIAYVLSYMGSFIDTKEAETVINAKFLLDTIVSLSVGAVFSLGVILYLLKSIPDESNMHIETKKMPYKKIYFTPIFIVLAIYIGYTYYVFLR